MSDIVQLAEAHGWTSTKRQGQEHHSPCPECGGRDRFWLNPNGGIEHTGRYACRQCRISGNAIDYGINFCGLTREEARIELDLSDRKKPKKEGFNPLTEGVEDGRFDYPKADGSTWLQKRKYRPKKGHRLHGQEHEKECLWYRHEPENQKADSGGWVLGAGTGDAKRDAPMYGADRLEKAKVNGGDVYVPEGEDDVDTCHEWGLVATTNPHGAGSWSSEKHASTLKGFDRAIVLVDNDAEGRGRGRKVAASLLDYVSTILLLPVFGGYPGSGHDVTDWMRGGGTKEGLVEIVGKAEPVTPGDATTKPPPLIFPGIVLSDATREKIKWMWHGYLAQGKTTILDGDPGEAKSLLCVDLIARLTVGSTWPDGSSIYEPGNAIIVTVEDGVGDTILPRLEEAGADLSRVMVIPTVPDGDGPGRVLTIPRDAEALLQTAKEFGASLLVIDPLNAHLDEGVNSYVDADVRRALAPFTEAANRTDVACLLVRHLTKGGGGNAVYRGGGSIGIIAAARIGLIVGKDPDDEDRRVLAVSKINIARKPLSMLYRVESSKNDSEVPVIKWEGTSELTANELCSVPGGTSKLDDAQEWLEEFLALGPKPSAEIFEDGKKKGYSKNTLYRAKKIMEIEAKKVGFDGEWQWEMPTPSQDLETQHATKMPIRAYEHLRGSSAGENGADSSNLTDSSLFDGSENAGGPSAPSERQDGAHEQAGGDGAATVPSVLVDDWDSESTDDIEGDE